jgi:hypothetical protein
MDFKYIILHSEGKLSDRKLLLQFSCTKKDLPQKIVGFFNKAIQEKNAADIEAYIYIVAVFDLYCQELTDIFIRLILEEWHERHEDIASILQEAKSARSVEALFKATNLKLDYLDYDDSHALAVKCIWALGEIGNDEAKEKLQVLSKSNNEIISDNAKQQINRIEKRKLVTDRLE